MGEKTMNLPDRAARLMQGIAWAIVFIVAFPIFQPLRAAHGAEKGDTVFTDKNGFFTCQRRPENVMSWPG
jgi:hypothetical protein